MPRTKCVKISRGNRAPWPVSVRAFGENLETLLTEAVLTTQNTLRVKGHGFYNDQLYNDRMNRIMFRLVVFLVTCWTSLPFALGEEPPQQPGAKDRLQQVLDAEGGTTVYMDAAGNVHSTTDLPNGDRIVTVQPPQIPGLNLGPPLQLNNRSLQLPQAPPVPAQPPPPDFPFRAR